MTDIRLGVLLWSQATTWQETLDGAQLVDRLGYDHLWTWDHLHAIYGAWDQPIFEGWSLLSAWAVATEHIRLGLLVGANTFRNPSLVTKTATTLDHISEGRAILGIGGAWFEHEHQAHGIDFGHSPGERLTWLDEAVGACRELLDGKEVTSPEGGRYQLDALRQYPVPVQPHLPIMIGGSGEKKTLRTVAKYADLWNAFGSAEKLAHKDSVLRRHCEEVGRDQSQIERTVGCKLIIRDDRDEAVRVWREAMKRNRTPDDDWDHTDTLWLGTVEDVAAEMRSRIAVGFETFIVEVPTPYDTETLERLIGEVRPLLERG